ncbi:hypothetical protein HDU97_004570 [Phlyctochytrium planicorne]|nr:hypothetical protein HDU97_004570 [Phlyctochytrium planicorne]
MEPLGVVIAWILGLGKFLTDPSPPPLPMDPTHVPDRMDTVIEQSAAHTHQRVSAVLCGVAGVMGCIAYGELMPGAREWIGKGIGFGVDTGKEEEEGMLPQNGIALQRRRNPSAGESGDSNDEAETVVSNTNEVNEVEKRKGAAHRNRMVEVRIAKLITMQDPFRCINKSIVVRLHPQNIDT